MPVFQPVFCRSRDYRRIETAERAAWGPVAEVLQQQQQVTQADETVYNTTDMLILPLY